MGLAYYIVGERELEGFDPFVNGKFLGQADPQALERICQSLNVKSPLAFFAADADMLDEFLADEGLDDYEEPAHEEKPPEEWFSAEEGLQTVRALIRYLDENPKSLKASAKVLADLKEYEAVLERFAQKNVRWRLGIDI